jgi:hypothetical protein
MLLVLLSHARARPSLPPCVFLVCADGFVAQGKATSRGRRPSAPPTSRRASSPLAAAAAPPHTRALGWAAVTTSRGRCPRRRGSCQEKREDGAVLLIAAELRQTPKLSGGRSSVGFVEAQEDAHFSNIKYYSERGLGPYIYNKAKSLPTPLALIK